jgi:hypothetical protein
MDSFNITARLALSYVQSTQVWVFCQISAWLHALYIPRDMAKHIFIVLFVKRKFIILFPWFPCFPVYEMFYPIYRLVGHMNATVFGQIGIYIPLIT